jgi:hypothetical protein
MRAAMMQLDGAGPAHGHRTDHGDNKDDLAVGRASCCTASSKGAVDRLGLSPRLSLRFTDAPCAVGRRRAADCDQRAGGPPRT